MDTPDFDHAVPLCITYNNRNSLLFPLTPTRSDRWHFDIIQKCARIYTFEFQHTIFKTLSKKSIRYFWLKFLHFCPAMNCQILGLDVGVNQSNNSCFSTIHPILLILKFSCIFSTHTNHVHIHFHVYDITLDFGVGGPFLTNIDFWILNFCYLH